MCVFFFLSTLLQINSTFTKQRALFCVVVVFFLFVKPTCVKCNCSNLKRTILQNVSNTFTSHFIHNLTPITFMFKIEASFSLNVKLCGAVYKSFAKVMSIIENNKTLEFRITSLSLDVSYISVINWRYRLYTTKPNYNHRPVAFVQTIFS